MKNVFLLTTVFLPLLFTTACYLTNVPIHPSPAAFRPVEESPFFTNGRQRITGMATDGTIVVAVSYEGTIAYSNDHGVTWQTADPEHITSVFPAGIRFNAVTWAGGYFLAGGDLGKAAWSQDGRVWNAGTIGPMNPRDILSLAGGTLRSQLVFVAGGTDGRLAFAKNSPQGPWFRVYFSPFGEGDWEHDGAAAVGEAVHSIAHGAIRGSNFFVAVGENGNIAIMRDFSRRFYGPSAAGTRQTFHDVSFGNDRFIAVGDGATLMISPDPKNYVWHTIRERGFGLRPFLNIHFDEATGLFVMITSGAVLAFSENGESWSAATMTSLFAEGISAVVSTRRRIILGGTDGVIVYSN